MIDNALSRREILAMASIFAGGIAWPRPVRSATDATLTMQMDLPAYRDPRLFDQPEMANVARGSNEPLIRYRRDGRFEPWLAESWTVSDDAREIRLTLRDGVRWSNGDPFTAEDVLFNLTRWCDSSVTGNSMATRLSALIDERSGQLADGAASMTGPREITLSLLRPDVTVIASLSDYPALLVHPDFSGDLSYEPIGTGPYDVSFTAGRAARLTRRPRWWGGAAAFETIVYLDLGPDPSAQIDAFARGSIDANYQSTGWFGPEFDALDLARSSTLSGATIICRVNRRTGPDNRRLRRALAQMVDNQIVLEIGQDGRGVPAVNAHVGPMHPDFAPIDSLPYDPSGAKRMLDFVGAADTELTLVTLDDDWTRLSGEAIRSQLLDSGLKLGQRILSASEFWANWRTHPFSVTEWSARPLGIQNLSLAYRSNASWNETGFASRAFDEDLDRALATPDPVARRAIMTRLEARLIQDGTVIQPFWRELSRHYRPGLRGLEIHPMLEHHHDLWAPGAR